MNPDPKLTLRERLLAAEAEDPALRADYDRRLQAMLEQTLSTPRKVWFAVLAVACVVNVAVMGTFLLTRPAPSLARVSIGLGIIFSLAWLVHFVRLIRRGTFRRKSDATLGASLVWFFVIATAILLAFGSKNLDPFVMFGFLFLLPASVIVLRTAVEQSELRTQERLLELEYKIARLSEVAERRGQAVPPAGPPAQPAAG